MITYTIKAKEKSNKLTNKQIVTEIKRYIKHRKDDVELGKCIRHFMSVWGDNITTENKENGKKITK
ncbi:MAG: hypothetical protein H8D94_01700 [Candidatus Pelagibacter sp.]|nr:hypothetical protein [Candidatus Pelagibacter sp.]